MKHPEKQIDTLFTQGLSSYEETPSPQAWDAIENQLPSNKSNQKQTLTVLKQRQPQFMLLILSLLLHQHRLL